MNAINYGGLARDLLRDYLDDTSWLDAGSDGLVGTDDDPGALDLAHACLCADDLPGALQKLDTAEALCREPVTLPTRGRNRPEEHPQALRTRARLLGVAQTARVLVLEALNMANGGAA